jgi:L-asparaginase
VKRKFGYSSGLLIILHGGAGPQDPSIEGLHKANNALIRIATKVKKRLLAGIDGLEVAADCIKQMENDPQFNAGIGSALQSDGLPRLAASIMDGSKQSFSGVISAMYIPNPSILALQLQKRRAKVLTNPGTELLARELKLPIHTNLTEKRSRNWLQAMDEKHYPANYENCDTVGCVIRDQFGHLYAASSTGGRGHEYPGRVGDTSTVAGNYASKFAAITVTGKGEQIVDDGIALRIETRVRDGMTLKDASELTFKEAIKRKRRYGWIAVDKEGNWVVVHTTKHMPYVVCGEHKILDVFRVAEE